MKRLLFLALLATSAVAQTETVGSGCAFAWEYPAEELHRITGYRLFVNDVQKKELPKTQFDLPCMDAGLATGDNAVFMRAYGPGSLTEPSNTLTFKFDPRPLKGPSMKLTVQVPK